MILRSLFILGLLFVWSKEVLADGESDVQITKKGIYPFMAYLMFGNPTIKDPYGNRFFQAAIIVKPNWLLSAALERGEDNFIGFPKKTLLARAGAVQVDSDFSLNEDEHEQEREVIQVVHSKFHNSGTFWLTDISMLKTLLPFDLTVTVNTIALNLKPINSDSCSILVFAKLLSNNTVYKVLTMFAVNMLEPIPSSCGTQFRENFMTCANDRDAINNNYEVDYCQGNAGGPLLCNMEIVGLQTYLDHTCKQPHLYHILYSWETLIHCGIEEKCGIESCDICKVVLKDDETYTMRNETESLTLASTETVDKYDTISNNAFDKSLMNARKDGDYYQQIGQGDIEVSKGNDESFSVTNPEKSVNIQEKTSYENDEEFHTQSSIKITNLTANSTLNSLNNSGQVLITSTIDPDGRRKLDRNSNETQPALRTSDSDTSNNANKLVCIVKNLLYSVFLLACMV